MRQLNRAVGGGFVATIVMTLLIYGAPIFGMPSLDVAQMLGGLFGVAEPYNALWWFGMVWHFVNGTILFALIYAAAVYPLLSGSPTGRGTVWGVVLWLLSMIVALPALDAGFFAAQTSAPVWIVFGFLLGHLVYGAILGAIAGPQAERVPGEAHPGTPLTAS